MDDRGDHLRVDLGENICAFFTTRGTARADDLSGLNLAHSGHSARAAVEGNRERVARLAGSPLQGMLQVHGNEVAVVTSANRELEPPRVDGIITADASIALTVLVADCVPILLADSEAGLVGAVHAGRRGVESEIARVALERMCGLGARPERIHAALGPAICGSCYEVPEEMRAELARKIPRAASQTSWGTPALDLPAALEEQLRDLGVVQVQNLGACTLERTEFYSYRRNPRTGRQAGVIRLQK